jgi:hypothetical protein
VLEDGREGRPQVIEAVGSKAREEFIEEAVPGAP